MEWERLCRSVSHTGMSLGGRWVNVRFGSRLARVKPDVVLSTGEPLGIAYIQNQYTNTTT